MAFFNSRKRQGTATLVVEKAAAPAPEAVSNQSSPAPLGAGLRLVSAPAPEPTLRLAEAPEGPEIEEDRAEDLRGLPLGTILYRQGLLQQDVLESALLSGMESGERLGEILIRQGLTSQDDIARALAAQRGLSFVPQEEVALSREVAALLPVADARELGAVPVRAEGDTVFVVTADPTPGQKDALEARLHRPVSEAVVSKGVFDSLLQDIEFPHLVVAEVFVPADDVPEHDHESEEEVMDQVWTGGNVEETAPEAWAAEPMPQEEWHPPFAEPAAEQAHEHVAEPEPAPVVEDEVVRELSVQHEASVGRIGDLLSRIEEGASSFTDLRARLGGLSESLRVAEESVADRDRRLADLTGAYEAGERRIEELVAQVHEREEELRGVGSRVEDLNGRLASAEERLDDRERRLEELFRQVERRDSALTAFEAKLDGIAAQFAGELQA